MLNGVMSVRQHSFPASRPLEANNRTQFSSLICLVEAECRTIHMSYLTNGGELFAPAGEDPTATLSVIVGDASITTIRSRIEVRFVELAPQVCLHTLPGVVRLVEETAALSSAC